MASPKSKFLDPSFLRKLERLRILARRAFPGATRGERRSTRRGASVEFADFRKYEAGDDFRHVDWNIYARLERLMLRQFVEEEDVRVDLLIDGSKSMRFDDEATKFDFACRTAACLAFIASAGHDMVGLTVFGGESLRRISAKRGRAHMMALLSFLESIGSDQPEHADSSHRPHIDSAHGSRVESAGRPVDLASALRRYHQLTARAGIVFVVSDFFDSSDFRRELKLLRYDGFDINLIQVLAADELTPAITGDYALVDSETGELCEITIDGRAMQAYKAKLAEYTTDLETFCRGKGIGYTLLSTTERFEDVVLRNFVQSRMTA